MLHYNIKQKSVCLSSAGLSTRTGALSKFARRVPMRPSGRTADQMRPVRLEPGFAKYAEGSCLVKFGETHVLRSEEHTSELQSLMRNSYAVFCLKKKTTHEQKNNTTTSVNRQR